MKKRNIINEIDQYLQENKNLILRKISTDSEDPPDVLYHYTNSNGIKGIIESGTFWATHHIFFSDPEELDYGIKICDEILSGIIKSEEKNNIISDSLENFINFNSNPVNDRWH